MTRTPSVSVIMYHRIGAETYDPADTFLNVAADRFAHQMALLARLKYRAITFAEAIAGLSGRGPLPRRAACITFDDAFRCVADRALPTLEAFHWPATVFVASGWIGKIYGEGRSAPTEADRVLDATGIMELSERGWEIGGHTRSHARLGDMEDDAALDEIQGGIRDLQSILGVSPRTFCYPAGSYNARTRSLVQQTELLGACTTRSGLARSGGDMFLIPRVKPAARDGMGRFLYRLLIRPHLP